MPTNGSGYIYLALLLALLLFANNSYSSSQAQIYSQKLLNRAEAIKTNPVYTGRVPNRLQNNMTMMLYQAHLNFDRLTLEAQDYFSAYYDERPEGLEQTHETVHFKFWYTNSGEYAVDPKDKDNNGIADYIDFMAEQFEFVWTTYKNEEFAFPPPDYGDGGNDKYDVYFSNGETGEGVYGMVVPEYIIEDNPNSTVIETDASSSYMIMRGDYKGFTEETTKEGEFNAARVTIAHEFFHAIQFGYGGTFNYETWESSMSSFMMEMCSTWSENWVYPEIDDNLQYLYMMYQGPDIPLNWENESDAEEYDDSYDYWYSTWLYLRFLTEQGGKLQNAALVKEMYENTISSDTDVQAIDKTVKKHLDSDFLTTVNNFYVALCLSSAKAVCAPFTFNRANDYLSYLDGDGLSGVTFENQLNFTGSDIHYKSTSDGDGRLMRLGADYVSISTNQNFTINFATTDDSLVAFLLKMDAPRDPNKLAIAVPTNNMISVSDSDEYSHYVLILVNNKISKNLASIQYSLNLTQHQGTDVEQNAQAVLPDAIHLYPTFPNPFNPTSMIKFSVPNTQFVSLSIYNMLGKKIQTLLDERIDAGTHTVTLNGEQLATGTYVIVLTTENQVLSQNIILIK